MLTKLISGLPMGRKREARSDGNDADMVLYLDENSEFKEEMQKLGLPVVFSGDKRPVPELECDIPEAESVASKRLKKNKKYISHLTVVAHGYTAKEIIEYHPDGLVLYKEESSPIVESIDNSHVQFDEDGQQVVLLQEEPCKEVDEIHQDDQEANDDEIAEENEEEHEEETEMQASIKKYQRQKYDLWHRYDEGIRMDDAGWFSVTPESIARHTALKDRSYCRLVLEAFAGVGGNAIQYALAGDHVVAIELDSTRAQIIRHNAAVYGASNYLDVIRADFFDLPRFWRRTPSAQKDSGHAFDLVFASPPWGGPDYYRAPVFDPKSMLPMDSVSLFRTTEQLGAKHVYFMPRQTDLTALARLISPTSKLIIEEQYLDERMKAVTIYIN